MDYTYADALSVLRSNYGISGAIGARLLAMAQATPKLTYNKRVQIQCTYSNGQSSRYALTSL